MKTQGLPLLPVPARKPARTLQCLILCQIIYGSKSTGTFLRSQRTMASNFNRSNSANMSKIRRQLATSGWITRIKRTTRLRPDEYGKGRLVKGNSRLAKDWSLISNSLFGRGGLLDGWMYSPGWAHGCLGETGMLVIATLSKSTKVLTSREIINYLEPLCSRGAIDRSLKKLESKNITHKENSKIILLPDWKQNLDEFFNSCPACNDRWDRGEEIRHDEQILVAQHVMRGLLTAAEESQLRKLPCVRCEKMGEQREHFPPMKYLDILRVSNSRHLIWSICSECNAGTKSFIKSLPIIHPVRIEYGIGRNTNPFLIYKMAANRDLLRFYDAVQRNDKPAAVRAIRSSYNFWCALNEDLDGQDVHPDKTFGLSTERRISAKASTDKSTFSSQLPL